MKVSLNLAFCCRSDNDVYRLLISSGITCERYQDCTEAVNAAPSRAGILILAEEYPQKTTIVTPEVLRLAEQKKQRLYIEYPSLLPGMKFGEPVKISTGRYGSVIHRMVVTSDFFGSELSPFRILAMYDGYYIPVNILHPHLVLARVAGYDTAALGLPDQVEPILFEHPHGNLLVSTTKLSQFITARYLPSDAWGVVWRMILKWLQDGRDIPALNWTPAVCPSYGRSEPLPDHAQEHTLLRACNWLKETPLLIPADKAESLLNLADRDYRLPSDWLKGDGKNGIMESFSSKRIFCNRSQYLID